MRLWLALCVLALCSCLNRDLLSASSTLRVIPASLPADGTAAATVGALLATDDGQVMPADAQLRLSSSEPYASITPFSAADGNGWRWAQVRSPVPGTQTLFLWLTQNGRAIQLPPTALVTFNPLAPDGAGVPSAQTSWLAASPNIVADDGQAATLFTLHVLDETGAPVPGAAVSFTSTGSNNFFAAATGITDVAGILRTTLSSTTAEVKTVTAHTGAMAVSTDVTFSPWASSGLYSRLVATPNSLVADGVSATQLTLTLRDTANLPLTGAPVTWVASGSNNSLTTGSATTDANGVATASLASTAAETKTVTATSGATQVSQSIIFVPGAISANNCTFVANPNLLTADNSSEAILVFTARDTSGNVIPNLNVSLSSTGSNNTLSPAAGTTNAAGVFTATMVSSTAENKTVTAASGSIHLTQGVTFLTGTPNATASSLTASPNALTADGTSAATLTVIIEDAHGNLVSGQAVTFAASGSNNVFGQSVGATNSAGQFTTTLTSTTAATKLVTVDFAGSSVSTDVSFFAGAPAASMTTISASPTSLTADGTSTTLLTVAVRDAYGNPVASQLVSLSANGSHNTFGATSGTTDMGGEFTATLASTTAEVKTISAVAGTATTTAVVTFVAGAPSSTTTTFVAAPTSVTADGNHQSTLLVSVHDVNGNPVPGQAVSIVSTGSNNTLSPGSGVTDATGVFSATLASTTAETKTLTATVGGGAVVETAAVTFVPGPADATRTTFVATPTTVTANDANITTLTLTVLDAFGTPAPNQSVSISSSGSNNVFGSTSGTTNSAGVFSTTLASITAEVKTITVTTGSVNKTATVTFVGGAPSSTNSTLGANPTSVAADGVKTTQLTFTVKDAYGNPLANQAVSFSGSGSNNTFNPPSGTTDATGTFATTLASTKAEVKIITGIAGAATATTSVTFNPGAVSGTATTLVANPNLLAADGTSQTTLVVTALDAQGNPVPGQSVSLSGSGTNNTFAPASGSTNAAGVFTATLTSNTVQSETLAALVAGSVTANTNVTFTAPVVNSASSTISANPNILTADGNSTTTLIITVLNDTNSPVSGATVTMSATGTANNFSPASGSTNASGVFTTTLSSTQTGIKTVTATVDGTSLNTNVTFVAGAPASLTTTLVASPNTVTADGTSQSTLTVLVKDSQGNPVPSQSVSLAASGGNNVLTPANGSTDATGIFAATLTSTLAQTETITATVSGFTKNTNVTFVAGTVSGVTTTLVASPNVATANGISAVTFTATVKDTQGNPVANQSVVLSSTGSNNLFTPPSGNTNGSGVFVATLTSTKAELKTITAITGTVNENANVTFVPGLPASGTSMLTLNPTTVVANGTSTTTVTVTAADANGNRIANQNVVLSASGASNTFTPLTGTTNPNGVFVAILSSTVSQTETITASVGSVPLTAAMTFVAGSPNSTTSSLTASPNLVVANGLATSTLTVVVKDAQGNPVPSQSVSLSSSGTSNTFSPMSGSTNNAGVFTATLASTVAQAKTVTATIGSSNEVANVTFTAGSPSGSTTILVASPSTIIANNTNTTTLTLTVEDAYGNAVANQNVVLSSTGSNNTFSPISGTTNASGVFTASLASTTAETKTITATVGSLSPTASVTFTAGAPTSGTSQVAVSPSLVTADGTSTTTVTVTVKDTYGNVVPNQAVSVSANGTSNIWSVASGTSGTTNASGVWATTLASTTAQGETITATIGTFNETTTISFVAGAPSGSTSLFTASPTSLPDDGATATTLQVTVEDAHSNAVSGQTVTFGTAVPGCTFSAPTCSTNPSGTCSVTLKSTVAQVATVSATFATVNKTASVTFTTGAASNANSTLSATPSSVADDGNTTSTLQVTVGDGTGNPVNGQLVTFASSGGASTPLSTTICTTNSGGVCSVAIKSAVAQTATVTATFATVTKTAAVTFVTGSPSSTASVVTANPNSLADDGVATTTVQVSVSDVTANPVNGQVVTFSSSGVNCTFSALTCTTNSAGQCAVTLKSTTAQTTTISAKFAGVTKTAMVIFNVGALSNTNSTLVASPASQPANGNSAIMLTVTAADGTGNPIPNQAVTLSASGAGNAFSATSGQTNASGVFTATLTSTTVQTETITAAMGSVNLNAVVTFTTATCATTYSYETFSVGSWPYGIAAADFNGDGKLDVVTADYNAVSASVLWGQGNATFAPAVTYAIQASPTDVGSGDFNGDGKLDLVAVNYGASSISILLGQGNSTFAAAVNSAVRKPGTSPRPSGLATGDFNGDGKLDVATACYGNNYVAILLGQGNGSLGSATSYAAGTQPRDVVAGDFNGDGKLDVAVANEGGNNVSVLLGQGSGTLGVAVNYTVGNTPIKIVAGDFNGDGKLDLVTSNYGGASISTLLGKGDGTFGPAAGDAYGDYPWGLAAADFNGDGKLDVATANYGSWSVSILDGQGDGTFAAASNHTTGSAATSPYYVAAGDFNGDGKMDLATTNSQDPGTVTILLYAGCF